MPERFPIKKALFLFEKMDVSAFLGGVPWPALGVFMSTGFD
jgi:hypothetical protein